MTSPIVEQQVDLVRGLLEALNEDWRQALDLFDELSTADLEWRGGASGIGGPEAAAVYRGREGVRRYWMEVEDAWSSLSYEVLEVRPVGDRVVIALLLSHLEGAHSGLEFKMEVGLVFQMRDGRIAGGCTVLTHAEAEEKARRLAEQAADA
jgi:ketosteroid isomerase-like protein